MMVDELGTACNVLRSSFDRLEAWNRYEAEQWAKAHIERDLPMGALPKRYDYCLGMGDRINAWIEAEIGARLKPVKVSA